MPWNEESYSRTIEELLAGQNDDYQPTGEATSGMFRCEFLNKPPEISHFTLDELRKFPRYLTDLTVKSNPSIITLDHYTYWAWTGAMAVAHPSFQDDQHSRHLRDLAELVHQMLARLRYMVLFLMDVKNEKDDVSNGFRRIIEYNNRITWFNPSLRSSIFMAERILSTMGFSVLEGLIKSHCPQLDVNTGSISGPPVKATWRPKQEYLGEENSPNYHDKLQIWCEYKATDEVRKTILQINDLSRYDPQTLINSINGITQRLDDEIGSTNHFLRLLHQLRNDNIHGTRGTRVIGSIVLNLCCLLFWDLVKPDEFHRHNRYTTNEIKSWRESKMYTPLAPETFLPLLRDPE